MCVCIRVCDPVAMKVCSYMMICGSESVGLSIECHELRKVLHGRVVCNKLEFLCRTHYSLLLPMHKYLILLLDLVFQWTALTTGYIRCRNFRRNISQM